MGEKRTENQYLLWSQVWCSTESVDQNDQSTGLIKIKPEEQKPVPLHELPDDVIKCIDKSHFYYDMMKIVCLRPSI